MADPDPLSLWRSWSHSGSIAHPYSPAGGTGPGRARLPGTSLSGGSAMPHPSSVAARHKTPSYLDQIEGLLPVAEIRKFLATLTVRESTWQFVTSAGGELSIGTAIVRASVNGTVGALWLKESETAEPVRLIYEGAGAAYGVSLGSPVNVSFSIPDMPSSGTVYKLPFAGQTLNLNELKGAFVLFGIGADFGAGWSKSLMFLGGNALIAAAASYASYALMLPALLATSNACVQFGGMNATVVPCNAGVSVYVGLVE
ncbi:MAG: hypothetical protein JWN04_4688 [Myxococcaceae bacterium]|nr:hypothetical protein [Myxococcaceae bacterium]